MLRFVARAVPQSRILSSLHSVNRSNTNSNNVTTTKDLTQRCIGTTSIFKDSLHTLQQASLDYQKPLLVKPSLVKPPPLIKQLPKPSIIIPNGSGSTNGGIGSGWGFDTWGFDDTTIPIEEQILNTQSKVNEVVDRIILDEHPALFNSLGNPDSTAAFYFFYTSNGLDKEAVAFLSNRGLVPNPILVWSPDSIYYQERKKAGAPDPSIITGQQMKHILKAKIIPLYESTLKFNARQVENGLQRLYINAELGKQRLNRKIVGNSKLSPPDGKVHKVGIIYSNEIPRFIEEGIIVVRK